MKICDDLDRTNGLSNFLGVDHRAPLAGMVRRVAGGVQDSEVVISNVRKTR